MKVFELSLIALALIFATSCFFKPSEKSSNNEIVVLSTNNDNLDSMIKTSLNYKSIAAENLEQGRKYTLPVSFQKK